MYRAFTTGQTCRFADPQDNIPRYRATHEEYAISQRRETLLLSGHASLEHDGNLHDMSRHMDHEWQMRARGEWRV